MFDEPRILLPVLEEAANSAGLIPVPEGSKVTEWPPRAMTSGVTDRGRRVDLEAKVIPNRSDAGGVIDRYRCHVYVLIEQELPAGLELIDWKSARKKNRYAWILRKSKYVPVPPQGDPVRGLTAADETERDLFVHNNWLVLTQTKSQIVQRENASFTAWVWEMPPLPFWALQKRVERETAALTERWTSQIHAALADAEKLRQLH